MAGGVGNWSWKSYSSNHDIEISQEIRSHAAVLYNEHVTSLFIIFDDAFIEANSRPNIKKILRLKAILLSLWHNVRPIVALNQPTVKSLKLNTPKPGIYTPDVGIAHVEELIAEMMTYQSYTYQNLMYTIQQIENTCIIIREILQSFKYFMRVGEKQIPGINVASLKYREMADEKTVEEFNSILGVTKRQHLMKRIDSPLTEDELDEFMDYIESDDGEERYEENIIKDNLSEIVKKIRKKNELDTGKKNQEKQIEEMLDNKNNKKNE